MSRITFATSAAMALAGLSLAIQGIIDVEFKPISVGLVLLLGGGVFALLYTGTKRRRSPESSS